MRQKNIKKLWKMTFFGIVLYKNVQRTKLGNSKKPVFTIITKLVLLFPIELAKIL